MGFGVVVVVVFTLGFFTFLIFLFLWQLYLIHLTFAFFPLLLFVIEAFELITFLLNKKPAFEMFSLVQFCSN